MAVFLPSGLTSLVFCALAVSVVVAALPELVARRETIRGGRACSDHHQPAHVFNAVANTSSGPVRGTCSSLSSSSCVFYGVPFALPPVGTLRWAPPVSVTRPAVGVRDGTSPGPACWQTPDDDVTVQSEDCLTVDVWAPWPPRSTPSSGGLPVIVFFYGGGALSGASSWYNFSRFVADGTVVVAANYRVGPLGFLALSELSEMSETGASGNYGLMDCDLAVQFAIANAKAFGGDPDQVTIMGQSSGATMVWGLVAHWWTRSSRPFQRAIALSGSPNVTFSRSRAEKQNSPLPIALGCAHANGSTPAAAVLACLRAAPAAAVSFGHFPINTTWQEYDALTWGLPSPAWRDGFPLPGVVIVDGHFLVESLAETLGRPSAGDPISLLISNVGEEDDLVPEEDFSSNATSAPLERFLDASLAPWGNGDPAWGSSLLKRFGFAGLPPQRAYLQLASTIGTVCGQLHLLKLASTSTPHAKLHYIAVVDGPSIPQILGVETGYVSRYAYHQYDLVWATQQWDFFADFAFGRGNHTPYAPTADDLRQSALLRGLYVSFATNGSCDSAPPFGGAEEYSVGLVHKTEVEPERSWRASFCDEMQRVGLWQPFWWAN